MKAEKLIVLGAGESGVGAAILGKDKGMNVFVSDNGHIPQKYKDILEAENIPYEEGGHTPTLLLDADEAVKSPGIPPTAPIVVALLEKGIPVISEIELAGRFSDAKMVCITGSNGKTTTTLLLHHILSEAGLNPGLAGNVGKSLALQVARDPKDVYVIELSSFQLENMYDFKADIAIMTNITPDHMDRYDHKMEKYVAAKFRILQNQGRDDWFIYWKDDPVISAQMKSVHTEAHLLPFSEYKRPDTAAGLVKEDVRFQVAEDVWEIPRDKISLSGLHNLYNAMAAGLSATVLHTKPETIKNALSDFEAVEHRLEYVDTIRGVRYINDSKATNVNSTWYALESMTTPTVLILGGKDKGNDYSEIEEFVNHKVKAIVAMGVDNSKILQFFAGKVPEIFDTHSMAEAVQTCARIASCGDTVLLSPCCASFDLFNSYEHRGEEFKKHVKSLK